MSADEVQRSSWPGSPSQNSTEVLSTLYCCAGYLNTKNDKEIWKMRLMDSDSGAC